METVQHILEAKKTERCWQLWRNKKMTDEITITLKTEVRMVQRCFIKSWLLPCSFRSHRTTNPTLKYKRINIEKRKGTLNKIEI